MSRSTLRTASLVVVMLGLAGCSVAGPGADDAGATVRSFVSALANEDGAGACALLAPATVESLEDDAGGSCDEAVLQLSLPADATDPQGRAYGRQAQVRTAEDVTFLTRSGGGWLITAAGCTARKDRPYDCLLEGS